MLFVLRNMASRGRDHRRDVVQVVVEPDNDESYDTVVVGFDGVGLHLGTTSSFN